MSSADSLPIIDAHHHFWDPAMGCHPWLAPGVLIPFRYGDYSAIKRPFLTDDFRALWGRHNVVASVTMEGEWDEADPVAESRWISDLAARTGWPQAHVARAILHRADADEVLAGHAAFPLVRAIRHKPIAAAGPDRIEARVPGGMGDPAWRRGYALLARHGLHFELQAPWWHAGELMDLIAAHPQTPVVINHTFLPADRSLEGLTGWRAALRLAASAPQVSIKISGIGLAGRPWSLDDNRVIIRDTIETFGPSRCMLASNFPVDGLTGSFETIYDGFLTAIADLPRADRKQLVHDTAIRVYRLNIPLSV